MTITSTIRWIFRPSRQQTLAQLDPETLRRERIRLEQTEGKLTRDIDQLEEEKAAFFRKSVDDASDRQRRQIARKIKQLDAVVQAKDRQLTLLSKNLQVLNSIAQIKESERLLTDLGMEGVVSKMDMDEVQAYIERATIEGQFQMERFTSLLRSVEDAEGLYSVSDDDSDIADILDAMDAAANAVGEVAIEDGLKRVDEILHKQAERSEA